MALPYRQPENVDEPRTRRGAGAFARFYWMLAGNAVVGFLAAGIALHASGLSWRDLAFWTAAGSLVAARILDAWRFGGTTADGKPATVAHVRRYAGAVAAVCGALWIAAHGLARFARP